MQATDLEGRLNADGSIDLRFSTDLDTQEVSIAGDANGLLLSVALQTIPADMIPEHDGFRYAEARGRPVLQFRFGEGHWLSIALGPRDIEVLRGVLTSGF